jgi:hypothetical protein
MVAGGPLNLPCWLSMISMLPAIRIDPADAEAAQRVTGDRDGRHAFRFVLVLQTVTIKAAMVVAPEPLNIIRR